MGKRKKGRDLDLMKALKIKLEAGEAKSCRSFEKEYKELHRIALEEQDESVYRELELRYLSKARQEQERYMQPWQKAFLACGELILICNQMKEDRTEEDFEKRKAQIAKQIAKMLDENLACFQEMPVLDEYGEEERYLSLKVYADILTAFTLDMRERCIYMAILWHSLRMMESNPAFEDFYGEKARKMILDRTYENFSFCGIDKNAMETALKEEEKKYIQDFAKEFAKTAEKKLMKKHQEERVQNLTKASSKEINIMKNIVTGLLIFAIGAAAGFWMGTVWPL